MCWKARRLVVLHCIAIHFLKKWAPNIFCFFKLAVLGYLFLRTIPYRLAWFQVPFAFRFLIPNCRPTNSPWRGLSRGRREWFSKHVQRIDRWWCTFAVTIRRCGSEKCGKMIFLKTIKKKCSLFKKKTLDDVTASHFETSPTAQLDNRETHRHGWLTWKGLQYPTNVFLEEFIQV